jgi:phosphoribosyl-AMP cyclohydrolase
MSANADLEQIDWGKGAGLVPAIVQHAQSGAVLMLGYMNRDALQATLARGRVVFYSRSRQRLWEKGESSGHAHAQRDSRGLRSRHLAGKGVTSGPGVPHRHGDLLWR